MSVRSSINNLSAYIDKAFETAAKKGATYVPETRNLKELSACINSIIVEDDNLNLSRISLPGNEERIYEGCYRYMFYGCSNLVYPPKLPVKNLCAECYKEMFASCGSLLSAPVLPGANLEKNCYYGMFGNCPSLSGDVYIHAETVNDGASTAMINMFQNAGHELTLHFKPSFESSLPTLEGYPNFGASTTVTYSFDLS